MRDLVNYILECQSYLYDIDIPYANAIMWTVNDRGTKRVGKCSFKDGIYHIEINGILLKEDIDETALKNTIIHEMLHTAPGCMDHGKKWKYYVDLVKGKYPQYDPSKRYSSNELGITPEEFYRGKKVYKVRCKCCRYIYASTRSNKYYRNPSKYICAMCGSELERI